MSFGLSYSRRMRTKRLLWLPLTAAIIVSPVVQAAGFWPFKEQRARQPALTVHSRAQHAVRPLGNHLHVVQPIGGARKPAKTILAKRPG